jgi:hypothetical protein
VFVAKETPYFGLLLRCQIADINVVEAFRLVRDARHCSMRGAVLHLVDVQDQFTKIGELGLARRTRPHDKQDLATRVCG